MRGRGGAAVDGGRTARPSSELVRSQGVKPHPVGDLELPRELCRKCKDPVECSPQCLRGDGAGPLGTWGGPPTGVQRGQVPEAKATGLVLSTSL